jgi:hypothetical protein
LRDDGRLDDLVNGPWRLGGRERRLAAVVEHQLVERHVELAASA